MIFCIIGKSASGKDTIYKRLIDDYSLSENVMFTTRPIRTGEVDGRDYFFVTKNEFELMQKNNLVIESRTYDTKYGDWTYFTSSLNFKINEHDYLLLNTVEGFKKLSAYFGKENVIPIYIKLDDGIRLERALKREMIEKVPKYDEMCRRFLADQKDFSDENLKVIDKSNYFENVDLEECLNSIGTFLEKKYGIKKQNKLLRKEECK